MSNKDTNGDDRQLRTLERWERLELEVAQAEHLACQVAEQERQDERERVLVVIENAQSFTRAMCDSGTALVTATLLLAAQYTRAQHEVLADAERALAKSHEAVEKAHEEVVKRSERLFGIEKLRDRRREQRDQDEARKEQNRLDEGALLKLGSEMANENRNF